MGANMVRRLHAGGHECVVYDVIDDAVDALDAEGVAAHGSKTLDDFVAALAPPRAVWLMVPAAFVGDTVALLAPLLQPGDTIIDGGNSWYHHDVDRSAELAPAGINYLDVGTSGGVFGLERGYCLMIGGDTDAVDRLAPIFDTLAPGVDSADAHARPQRRPVARGTGLAALRPERRRPLREDGPQRHRVRADGGLRRGSERAGEGQHRRRDPRRRRRDRPARGGAATTSTTSTCRRSREVWRRGSVISSWLLDLTAEALHADPRLDAYSGVVSDSGEGRWTISAAIDEGVPVPVLSAALYERFSSRGRADVADKVLSAMRAGFGGHHERTESTR